MIWDKISKENLLFILVDYQEKFFPLIKDKYRETAQKNIMLLVRMFGHLGIPMIGTDHYRKGLGLTEQEVLDHWSGYSFKDKITFSAFGSEEFRKDFAENERDIAVVCGLETHICVLQTVLDLRRKGKEVLLISDGCLSSTTLRWHNGLDLAKEAGAHIMNAETLIFYLLERAGTPDFKFLVKLLKDSSEAESQ
ncbi:isochorismatase family protein [Spirochaeta isovalerica]|uniref:Nicotinamidase-related amidase n=1 Tax=Spirochaeta isovalerica TaxID=150 RepID=A0A841RAV5_9SPIO|nr:isochorismatase family protein [Spirochaeta isovalerica]MBB6479562.1 nicotinamidase-related amidase [Spirochaeta isovalerica]